MAIEKISKALLGDSPGRSTQLNGYRIGKKGDGKKAYLQAALHSDEQPGIMVLHHLLILLFEADKNNQIEGEFVVFPMVNPLGMSNIGFGMHQGRYDLPSGVNFNRQWPDVYPWIKDDLDSKLGPDPGKNVEVIRHAFGQWLEGLQATTVRQQLRRLTLLEAYDSNYVFDLHCDDESLLHLFSAPDCHDEMQKLSDFLGCAAIMTASDSGGGSFDEVCPLLWSKVQENYPDLPIPNPVAGCTIELRGQGDVFDVIGQRDAEAIFSFFQDQGLITGAPLVKPKSTPAPTSLNATEIVRVDRSGLLAYKVKLGQTVTKGELIAELISLQDDDAFISRYPIVAGTSGTVISRLHRKYVWPGCSIAKIVGTKPLESRGTYLLED